MGLVVGFWFCGGGGVFVKKMKLINACKRTKNQNRQRLNVQGGGNRPATSARVAHDRWGMVWKEKTIESGRFTEFGQTSMPEGVRPAWAGEEGLWKTSKSKICYGRKGNDRRGIDHGGGAGEKVRLRSTRSASIASL